MNDSDLNQLLSFGFVPENLPKSFHSESFSSEYASYSALLEGNKVSIPYKYDVYKKKYAIRRWALLNPYNFALLAKTMREQWVSIQPALDSSGGFSLTPVKFGMPGEKKALRKVSKAVFEDTVFSKSSSMNVLLTTDIVEHYDSTYTHAIAWAIHTKETAKRMHRDLAEARGADKEIAKTIFSEAAGNILDRVVRDGDEQQTHGIPTGPQTSRIVSELVLSAIDGEYIQMLQHDNISFIGGRYVDDYEVYFENERDADMGLQLLREVLNKYGYRVGESKTYVLAGPPIPVDEEWRRKLRRITPKALNDATESCSVDDAQVDFRAIKNLIKEAVVLTRENDNPKIIRSLLSSQLRKYKCADENWELFEVYLLQMLANYPNTAKQIFFIVQNHGKGAGGNVASVLNRLLSSKNTTIFDALWLLYGCLLFEVELTKDSIENIVRHDDPLLWLILTHLKHNAKADIEDELIQLAWSNVSLYDEGWLFKYEAVRQGWIADNANIVNDDPFFGQLLRSGVSFYLIDKGEFELEDEDIRGEYEEEDFDIDPDFEPDPDWIIPSGR